MLRSLHATGKKAGQPKALSELVEGELATVRKAEQRSEELRLKRGLRQWEQDKQLIREQLYLGNTEPKAIAKALSKARPDEQWPVEKVQMALGELRA